MIAMRPECNDVGFIATTTHELAHGRDERSPQLDLFTPPGARAKTVSELVAHSAEFSVERRPTTIPTHS